MDFGIASYAAITAIAFLIGYSWKTSDKLDDKWIPCVCGLSGCILGIVAFLIKIPDFPASDIINAGAVGIVSGFSATAIHQVYKQLSKKDDVAAEISDDTAEVATESTETAETESSESAAQNSEEV